MLRCYIQAKIDSVLSKESTALQTSKALCKRASIILASDYCKSDFDQTSPDSRIIFSLMIHPIPPISSGQILQVVISLSRVHIWLKLELVDCWGTSLVLNS
jgi:hypothetical protein